MKKQKRIVSLMLILILTLCLFSPLRVEAASKVKLNKKSTTICVGKTETLKISGTKKKVTWKSSNKNIAKVSSKGKITAKKAGATKITAKVSGKKYTCKVTVKALPTQVKSLSAKNIGTSSVTLSWKKTNNTNGYYVYRSTDKKSYTKIATINKNSTTSYSVNKLQSGKSYYFKVCGYEKIGKKTYQGKCSSVLSVKTLSPSKPIAPVTPPVSPTKPPVKPDPNPVGPNDNENYTPDSSPDPAPTPQNPTPTPTPKLDLSEEEFSGEVHDISYEYYLKDDIIAKLKIAANSQDSGPVLDNSNNPTAFEESNNSYQLCDPVSINYPYVFLGWYSDLGFEHKITTLSYKTTSNITVYGLYRPAKYTIHYNGNGATGSFPDSTYTYRAGGTYSLDTSANTCFSMPGYNLTGWGLSPVVQTPSKRGSYPGMTFQSQGYKDGDTVNIYAQWESTSTRAVYNPDNPSTPLNSGSYLTYDLNGGTNHPDNPSAYDSSYGVITLKAPTRAGYRFLGWYSSSDYASDKKVETINATASGNPSKLYAKWEIINYSITYVCNHSSSCSKHLHGSSGSLISTYTIDTECDLLVDLPSSNESICDCVFMGWYKDPSFTKPYGRIAKGTTGNITLYAKWITMDQALSTISSSDPYSSEVNYILQYVNDLRAQNGLAPLTLDPTLTKAARMRSFQMAGLEAMSHYWRGQGVLGLVIEKMNIKFSMQAGENIGVIKNLDDSNKRKQVICENWYNSEGHRKNMLTTTYHKIGIAVVKGSTENSYYYTQVFSD